MSQTSTLIKKIENYDQYFKDIILDEMPNRLVNDFLGDIIYITWLILLTIGIALICYKIYPVVITVQLLMRAHTLPPPIPPRQ